MEVSQMANNSNESICNEALIILGKKPCITNLNGVQSEEKIFNELFHRVKRSTIRRYRPNSAVARAILSQDPNYIPRWGFLSGYKYPENMVKLLEVANHTWVSDEFPIEGQWILTHIKKAKESGYPAESLYVKYLEDKATELLDDSFLHILALELAIAAAPAIDPTRENQVIALRDIEVEKWAADNAQENGFTVEEYDPLFDTITTIRSV